MSIEIPDIVIYIAMALVLTALLFGLIRLIIGPGVSNRLVAFELISLTILAFILLLSVATEEAIYTDIPVIIALVSFIGTVAISTYLKQKGK